MLDTARTEAVTDALTGLGNRRRLMADLEAELAYATADEPAALALFDLNGFKDYNDTYGHPAGDALLASLGSRAGRGGRGARAPPTAWAATSSACSRTPGATDHARGRPRAPSRRSRPPCAGSP